MTEAKNQKYPLLIRILHWVMAIMILGMIYLGNYMTDLAKDDPSRGDIYGLHKSIGTMILLLVVLRLGLRITSKRIPPLPEGISPLVKSAAKFSHYILYSLMFLVPLLGYMMSNSAGFPVKMFGLPMPIVFAPNKELFELTKEAHKLMAYTLLALVILHFMGAMKHRYFEKKENDVLGRML